MKLLLASLCSALALPEMLWNRRLPNPPPPDKIIWQPEDWWWHNLKNYTTEIMRADCQWWSKVGCFAVWIAFPLLMWLTVLIS